MNTSSRKFKIIIFLIFIGIVGGGAYSYLIFNGSLNKSNSKRLGENFSSKGPSEASSEANQKPKSWNEYKNAIHNFLLLYPQELSVKEYDEGNNSYTVVFEDAGGEKNFQIFITPYFGEVINRSRIFKDIPSGKFTEPMEIIIGVGVRALAFLSENDFGQMREIWFLRNGYLYEVTTYADLDQWLSEVMKTWRFL